MDVTENPKYKEHLQFHAPFSAEKLYFPLLLDAFISEPRLPIPKTREMMTSWCAMVYATNRWHKAEVIVQTDSEDKAKQLVS